MKKITDPAFKYTSSANTDVARTFRRIRAEHKAKEALEAQNQAEAQAKVKPLIKAKIA